MELNCLLYRLHLYLNFYCVLLTRISCDFPYQAGKALRHCPESLVFQGVPGPGVFHLPNVPRTVVSFPHTLFGMGNDRKGINLYSTFFLLVFQHPYFPTLYILSRAGKFVSGATGRLCPFGLLLGPRCYPGVEGETN